MLAAKDSSASIRVALVGAPCRKGWPVSRARSLFGDARWRVHFTRGSARVDHAVASPMFPGMENLGAEFKLIEEWYSMKNFAPDLHVILAQETVGMKGGMYQRPSYPSTWARRHGQGRVFFTSMAHRENVWIEQPFQQIVLGGLAWVLGNVDVDITPNIATVTPECQLFKG
ncbi:MAG: ThuA domain-containing protein [Pirellulaceae bacterium]